MIGGVLWFNFKKGFGNVLVCDPASDNNEQTLFVHYSNIKSTSNFKRLYPGEYVSFMLGKHEEKDVCIDVTGVNGGPLLIDNSDYSYRLVKSYKNNNLNSEENDGDGDGDGN